MKYAPIRIWTLTVHKAVCQYRQKEVLKMMKSVVISLGLVSLVACASAPAAKHARYGVTCYSGGQPISGASKDVKVEGTVVTMTNDDGSTLSFVNHQCIIGSKLED